MKKYRKIQFRSPVERFKEFIKEQQSVGIVIICATLCSLLFANFIWKESYIHIWHSPIQIHLFDTQLHTNFELIINDLLMPVFFLLVGLEIKREIIAGELSSMKTAMLPVVAAIGGMIVPALIYFAFNHHTQNIAGWAIPTATDIAFALAIMAILGDRVPLALKLLLTTLAVVDDLGAILVIAVFYTAKISYGYLLLAALAYAILWLFNYFKIKTIEIYLLIGTLLWYFILQSGIHATIAGVLLASAIPYDNNEENNLIDILEKVLHLPVNFLILPLFAMCNTAILLDLSYFSKIGDPMSMGIIIGLVVGKTIGIFSFVYFSTKLKLLSLPKNIRLTQLFGTAMLGGIGFTMSIFIAMLAFSEPEKILAAKLDIMLASVIAGLLGYLVLFLHPKPKENQNV